MNIDEIKTRAREMFVNFSEILGKRVKDMDGVFVGDVWDISAKVGEVYPKSDELIISVGRFRRTYAALQWSKIARIEDSIFLNVKKREIKFSPEAKQYEFLFKRDVLDQQVVDTFNHKVRRVNDVHFLRVNNELVIAHVEIGTRGLLRRLGWEKPVDMAVSLVNKNSPYLKQDDVVSWKYIQPVSLSSAGMTMKLSLTEKQLLSIPPADLGDMIFDLDVNHRMVLFRSLDLKTKSKVFEHLTPEEQKTLLRDLDKKEAALIISHMPPDEATDFLERLPRASVANLLTLVESARAKKLSTLLGYSSDSAGGLMTTEFVSVPETATAGDAIEFIKSKTREFESVFYIYIVDDKNRLKGITAIRLLLFAAPGDNILKTAFPSTVYVHLRDSAREVAYLMDRYKVSAIPVVDERKVLQGIITSDDILSQVIAIAWRRRPKNIKGV